jgi:hypothetical protein
MAKHDDKQVPGTPPGSEVRGDLAEQRYGAASENTTPEGTAAPGSVRSIIAEEIAKAFAAAGIGQQPEERQAVATRKSLDEPSERLRRVAERQANAVPYRATAPVFVDSVGGQGGLYIRAGETFVSDRPPGDAWEPLDAEGKRRKEQVAHDRRERQKQRVASENALFSLERAQEHIRAGGSVGGRVPPEAPAYDKAPGA